ncbi:MAG: SET domain-containing protein-lysine N-methyltransferase [Verrucomicrobia bacterium]|nr:SET domain-containing protein-lysine N-methyltransferase [Verrucomicrobiota bacterium]
MPKAQDKPLWIVRRSSIHQRGVFAACDIPKDRPIIEYVGEKITKKESTRRGLALEEKAKKTGGAAVYIFTLNARYDLDGATAANPARLINHSCDPNCESFIIRGHIWIYSLREIKAGEELSFNYGFDLETWEDHPCRCGEPCCVGYILDKQYWPKLRGILKARAKRQGKIKELENKLSDLKKTLTPKAPKKPKPVA